MRGVVFFVLALAVFSGAAAGAESTVTEDFRSRLDFWRRWEIAHTAVDLKKFPVFHRDTDGYIPKSPDTYTIFRGRGDVKRVRVEFFDSGADGVMLFVLNPRVGGGKVVFGVDTRISRERYCAGMVGAPEALPIERTRGRHVLEFLFAGDNAVTVAFDGETVKSSGELFFVEGFGFYHDFSECGDFRIAKIVIDEAAGLPPVSFSPATRQAFRHGTGADIKIRINRSDIDRRHVRYFVFNRHGNQVASDSFKPELMENEMVSRAGEENEYAIRLGNLERGIYRVVVRSSAYKSDPIWMWFLVTGASGAVGTEEFPARRHPVFVGSFTFPMLEREFDAARPARGALPDIPSRRKLSPDLLGEWEKIGVGLAKKLTGMKARGVEIKLAAEDRGRVDQTRFFSRLGVLATVLAANGIELAAGFDIVREGGVTPALVDSRGVASLSGRVPDPASRRVIEAVGAEFGGYLAALESAADFQYMVLDADGVSAPAVAVDPDGIPDGVWDPVSFGYSDEAAAELGAALGLPDFFSADRFGRRAEWVRKNKLAEFVNWRAERVTGLYRDLAQRTALAAGCRLAVVVTPPAGARLDFFEKNSITPENAYLQSGWMLDRLDADQNLLVAVNSLADVPSVARRRAAGEPVGGFGGYARFLRDFSGMAVFDYRFAGPGGELLADMTPPVRSRILSGILTGRTRPALFRFDDPFSENPDPAWTDEVLNIVAGETRFVAVAAPKDFRVWLSASETGQLLVLFNEGQTREAVDFGIRENERTAVRVEWPAQGPTLQKDGGKISIVISPGHAAIVRIDNGAIETGE